MHFTIDEEKFNQSVDQLAYQGDVVAKLEDENYLITFETNGGDWYEIVIFQRIDGQWCEQWFSDCYYDEEKTTPEDLKNIMLDCLDLI